MSNDVLVKLNEAGVLRLTLNRPQKKNALTGEMYAALAHALTRASEDEAVRVVLIRGQEEAFTAGNDLADFLNNPPQDMSAPVMRFLMALPKLNRPLVAAVGGPAVGVGTTLLLHCDYVLATEQAFFQLPFVSLGLCAEGGSSLLLPQRVGTARAAEMLLLGTRIDAQKAHAWGLVNELVPQGGVLDRAREIAEQLAKQPASALQATRRLMREAGRPALETAILQEAQAFMVALKSEEAQAAFRAFFDKQRAKSSSC